MPPRKDQSPVPGKTAFVFAGGGSLGAVQIGMLKALVAHGVTADMVVGSSVGAINGAYFAGRPDVKGVAELERLWRGLDRNDIFPLTWPAIARFVWRRDFLVSGDGLRGVLNRHLPYRELQQARIPIHIVATDFLSGATVVLSSGPADTAILASCAIPAAFAAVEVDRRYLVDGAVEVDRAGGRLQHAGQGRNRAGRDAIDRTADGIFLCAPPSTARCDRERVARTDAADRRTTRL